MLMLCQHADYNSLGEKTARWSPTLGEHLGDGEFREETLLCMGGETCSWSLKLETLVLGRGGSWSRGRRATYWSGSQLGGNKEKQN